MFKIIDQYPSTIPKMLEELVTPILNTIIIDSQRDFRSGHSTITDLVGNL